MGLRDDYNNWPLGRQLQVIFIISGFFLTLILVIITRFQLDWLRDKVINDSSRVLEDNIIAQMRELGLLETEFINNEISNYIDQVKKLNYTDHLVHGYSTYKKSIINNSDYLWNSDVSENILDYKNSTFFSRFDESIALPQILEDSPMSKIYPNIYFNQYKSLYQGFEDNEVLHLYPATKIVDTDYSPVVREWYYKAIASLGKIIMEEPFWEESNSQWVTTFSTAMLFSSNNSAFGVAAVDAIMKNLTTKISEIKILNEGFLMLISSRGTMMSMPKTWYPIDSTIQLRLFDESYTGISETIWNSIKNSFSGSRHDFIDINGTEYLMIKHDITPFEDKEIITHYLLLCAKKIESEHPKDNIKSNFTNTYVRIFWVTLSMGIISFLSVGILIFLVTKKVSFQLKIIESMFGRIIRRGLFPKMTKGIHFSKLEKNSKGIESLVDACKDKIQRVKDMEESYNFYKWGFSRPNEILLYQEWTQYLYPYSLHTDKPMSWRQILPNLNRVLG